MTSQPGLFPSPQQTAKRLPRSTKPGVKPSNTRIKNVSRKLCDYCTLVVHEDGGQGGAEIRVARYRRTDGVCDQRCRDGLHLGYGCAHILFLCDEHAKLQLALDKEASG